MPNIPASPAPKSPDFEKLGDLYKSTDAYRQHEGAIQLVREMLEGRNNQIWRVLKHGQDKGRVPQNIPSPSFVDKPTHLNCDGIQILFHNLGMEAFRKDKDQEEAAELRGPLRHIAAVRISLMQYETNKRAVNYVNEITELDAGVARLAPHVEVPALTPYLFKPQTAISQLKKLAGSRKFEDESLLMNMGVLYAGDTHILHAVCMSMVTNGMADGVPMVITNAAIDKFRPMGLADERALQPFFQTAPDLFNVYVIGLVESGQTEQAITWCNRGMFFDKVRRSDKLSAKYAAALRHQGRFDEAVRFLTDARDTYHLQSTNLNREYQLALRRDRTIET